MADRQRGVQIHRPIIYGSHARLLTDAERELSTQGHTHRWTVFLTSAASPPPKAGVEDDFLPGGADDLSYLIKKVTFKLHETYPNPSRVLDKPPYVVSETGWGEFVIQIRIQFVNEAAEKPMIFQHGLKLHHWGKPIEDMTTTEGSVSVATGVINGSSTPSAAGGVVTGSVPPLSGAEKKDGEADSEVKAETSTPRPDIVMGEDEDTKADPETSAEASGSQPPPSAAETHHTRAHTHAQVIAEQRVSAAAKWPVLAWQYDELVFSDPPLAFYNLLNEHPPTKLPAKNRRPRDQREQFESKKKAKTKNAIASSSRQATVEPVSTPATQAVGTPAADASGANGAAAPARTERQQSSAATPAPTSAIVGIPGEFGSADVPLEFTTEMEKAEWNKLHTTRTKIIDEMDRWRSKLIEHEKELAKLKEEMTSAG
ncbi:yeats family-domain-containing protein [Kockovaella imperatae]|uniref:Protein AF-9 homolog n=1 Tax=Kockovaella imperatae TaxID=4999 RepID=A0A1Y1USK6_9TREE|nr:yeats family-domain-containing protein [Kockovaella imperatae]ORX40627.1 yeats family-domain-containing protein [Kockovaella imperatae]